MLQQKAEKLVTLDRMSVIILKMQSAQALNFLLGRLWAITPDEIPFEHDQIVQVLRLLQLKIHV